MTYKPREIGLSCVWADDRHTRCRAQFSYTVPKGMRYFRATNAMHVLAGKAGWVMGLDTNAQAHYACPAHADTLIDAMVLT